LGAGEPQLITNKDKATNTVAIPEKFIFFILKFLFAYSVRFSAFPLFNFLIFQALTPSQSAICNAPIIPFLIGSIASLID
jgi:hypothetical protein